MNETVPLSWSLEVVVEYGLMGLCVGVAYYMAQRLNQRLLLASDQRWMLWLFDGLRIVMAIGFFAWLASIGSVPVLSAFVGFLAGRLLAVRIVPGPE